MNDEERDLDREVEDLEKSAEKVQDDIDQTKSDWQSKQDDESVPGATGGDDDLASEAFAPEEDEGG